MSQPFIFNDPTGKPYPGWTSAYHDEDASHTRWITVFHECGWNSTYSADITDDIPNMRPQERNRLAADIRRHHQWNCS